jgi:hypothetical protein
VTAGYVNRRIMVQEVLGIKQETISKTIRAKRAGVVAQEIEGLLTKHKTLSSKPKYHPPTQKKPTKTVLQE